MNYRYELRICQLDPLWRVAVRDRGQRVPEYCREYPSKDEATAYARGRGLQLLAAGEHARVVVAEDGESNEIWSTMGDALL
jgi:hypothetical protein